MKYFQSTIERLLYYLLLLLVIVNVTEGILVYNVVANQNAIIKSQQATVTSLKAIVGGHTGTLNAINNGFTNLNSKVDCIFQYFTTPNRTGNTTATLSPNQKVCDINVNPVTSASGGSTGSTKSVQ